MRSICTTYWDCLSFSSSAALLASNCLTSSTRPYCTLSLHSSTFGRYVRFSSRVWASFSGFVLAAIASFKRRISSSRSAISSSVCQGRIILYFNDIFCFSLSGYDFLWLINLPKETLSIGLYIREHNRPSLSWLCLGFHLTDSFCKDRSGLRVLYPP